MPGTFDVVWTCRTELREKDKNAKGGVWVDTRALILQVLREFPEAFEAVREALVRARDG